MRKRKALALLAHGEAGGGTSWTEEKLCSDEVQLSVQKGAGCPHWVEVETPYFLPFT